MKGNDQIPDFTWFTSRHPFLNRVIKDLSVAFQPAIDRIRAKSGLGTMSSPQEISLSSEKTFSNEFRVVRRDTGEEASVSSSGAPIGSLVPVGAGDVPSDEEGVEPLEAEAQEEEEEEEMEESES